MRDNQTVMLMFVKIIERYPEIYDSTKESYKMRHAQEKTWESIATDVRTEIKEECTVYELKVKWKGIRSSFTRFKNKLYQSGLESTSCKKYYLYDSLRFLDPFTRPKGVPLNIGNVSGSGFDSNEYYEDVDDSTSMEYTLKTEEWEDHDVKPDMSQNAEKDLNDANTSESENEIYEHSRTKKRKHVHKDLSKANIEDNEDMQFFRSVLPDIKNFTSKEKRKFKMRILQLIDEIEDERKRCKSSNEVSSS